MEKQELTEKQMLDTILASDWEGKNQVNENSPADVIRQVYYRMMHALEIQATKKLDLLISDARERTPIDSKGNKPLKEEEYVIE